MTSLRFIRRFKSATAAVVSSALFITSTVTPVAAQTIRAGAVSEAGASVRGVNLSLPGGSAALPAASLSPASLTPALSPVFAPNALISPTPMSAAAKNDEKPAGSVPEAKPAATPVTPAPESDGGPRWVEGGKKPAEPAQGPRWVKTEGEAASAPKGPRWIGPAPKGRVRAALSRFLPFLDRSGDETFDGAAKGRGALEDGVAAKTSASASAGLSKPSARATSIINDSSIPTPEAARRVGELRSTPLWAKVAAPLSVIAAAAVAIHFGAVPVLTLAAGLVVSVLAHEIAHIAVLHRLGDHTAEHAGSHSLNPFNHIDAVKTVIVPAISLAASSLLLPFPILIGAAKPVDADFNNLRSPFGGPRSARNAFWVAAAGPATNLVIAGLAFGAAALLPAGGILAVVALGLAKMNLALAVFNMLPLPQLDGGKILASVLPERFYAKWVFNPKVERGYQGVFRRLYEGPSNVLTWLADAMGVRTQKGVNRLANGLTFTALAAFYAAAYFHFALALPLLFLALPCSYDYWCIREKVRSEAAVQDLMELMSQWSAVIVQIAEDLGLESEVSAYETEHAMKNALEDLVDEMMAKEEFAALSDEQKLEELMKVYPDKAAGYLKQKAMTEDSLEKIRAVLADPRNAPFYERLRKWFKDHEIFKRWDNKHQQGKLKDAMKGADKERGQGGGGVQLPENPLTRGVSALVRGLLSAPSIGEDGAPDFMNKVESNESASANVIAVDFFPNTPDEEIARVFAGLEYTATAPAMGYYRIEIANRTDGALLARRIARDSSVARVVVAPALREAMTLPVPTPAVAPTAPQAAWTGKIKLNNGYPLKRVRVVFERAVDAREAFRQITGLSKEMKGGSAFEFSARSPSDAAELARTFAGENGVKSVVVSAQVHELLLRRRAAPAPEAPAAPETPAAPEAPAETPAPQEELPFERTPSNEDPAPQEAPAPAEKVAYSDAVPVEEIHVQMRPGFDSAEFEALKGGMGSMPQGAGTDRFVFFTSDRNRLAQALIRITAHPAVVSAATNPANHPSVLAPKPVLPEKIKSHGKAEYGVNVILVKFVDGTPEGEIRAALARHGQSTLYRHGDMYTVSAPGSQSALDMAPEIAAEPSVEAVKVHPNVAARMTADEEPYADAQTYDPERAIIVDFKEGTTQETIKEYAEVRRLVLVNGNFRGSSRAALLSVPAGADVRATLQMLVDETAAPHSAVESVRPFQEQPGEAELKPSEAAIAAAAPPAPPAPPKAPRRDPAQSWLEYLQNVTLNDGKSKLTDKQVQLLTVMLKPVAKSPDEKRPPVVGRGEEVKRMLPIVTSPRGMRNSVILIGEAGVGKTAVPEGLAEMIEDAEAAASADSQAFLQFQRLKGRWLVELDINKVLTQEDPVGILGAILDLLPRLNTGGPSRGNDVIVLMDEIQKFFLDNAGQKIANTLKGPLRDGKVSVIATTTRDEYRKFIESDDAFRRRFEKIDVEEPTVEQTITILRAMKSWLQGLHDASIPDQVLVDAAKLTDQFDKTNFNPDKAIKAVQDASELSRPDNLRAAITLDLRETWGALVVAVNEARQALIDKGIASTLALPVDAYNKIAELVKKAESLYAEREAVAEGKGQVDTAVVKRVIAAKTGIASGQLNLGEEDAARYTKIEEEIGRRVVNQNPALTAIANAVRRNKAGLSNPNRPMGKFLLTGPTGVGKTYLAKELARFLFNDPEAMIRLDMSEYMEEHTAQRLTGSPPGYVGYGEGGQLTEAVRKKPYSVILFDEIEKAHVKVFDVLLQILDDGRLTDGQGRTVDFKNTVIILTSNAGMSGVDGEKYAKLLAKIDAHNKAIAAGRTVEADAKPLPTVDEVNQLWDEEIDLMVGAALKERFRPEFLNRLDEDPSSKNKWIRVNRLRPQDIAKIASIQLAEFQHLLADRHDTDIHFDQSVIDFLSVEGYSPLYGARPMTAAIEKNIIDPLAQWILGEAAAGRKDVRGSHITVGYADGKVTFEAKKKPEKNIARATVQGASEAVAAEVFRLLEGLVSTGEGEEPDENLFDKLMRKARPQTAKTADASGESAARTTAFLSPGTPLEIKGALLEGEHNNPNKKDAKIRLAIQGAREFAAGKGWGAAALEALDVPAGQVGEGWLKQFVKLAKSKAAKDASAIGIRARFEDDLIQVAVEGGYELSADDVKSLAMHFSGKPVESYLQAQQKADNLNLSARLLWDHNMLDLYRRLSAIPGARMGFVSEGGRTQIWLEIRKQDPAPALKAEAKPAPAAETLAGTPHQIREAAKTRELLMKIIDQSRLKDGQEDGTAIKVAAAEGYARLARPSDAATAREWIKSRGWTGGIETSEPTWEGGTRSVKKPITSEWPLAMTAALILEKYGTAEDVELLEGVSRRITGTSHYEVPVHQALTQALSALYARLGLAATRAALRRAASLKEGHTADILNAAKRALGTVGMPADLDEAKNDGDSYLAMMKRLGRTDELLRIFRDTTFWGNANDATRQAALKYAGEAENGEEALHRFKNYLKLQTSYSRLGFEVAYGWAAVAARAGLTQGLGDEIHRYVGEHPLSDYSKATGWAALLAYVELARLAGGADVLGPLEELMDNSPSNITPVHEQPYFSAPDAWARALVRSGKFDEYARSQGLDANGAPKPSKLQEMLTSQTRPMFAAAALRAIAYARDPAFKDAARAASGPVPDIRPAPPAPTTPFRGPSNPRFRDDWPPHGGGHMW